MNARVNRNVVPVISSPPRFWSSLLARNLEHSGGECDCDCADCVCDACSDIFAQAHVVHETQTIAQKIARGAIRSLAFNEDGFFAHHGEYFLVAPSVSGAVVILEKALGDFLADQRGCGATSIEKYREILDGSDLVFEKSIAFLISHNVLTSPEIPQEQPSTVAAGTLNAWLHLTDRCNLRCQYCYIPRSQQSMTEENAKQSAQAVFRSAQRNGFSSVKLKFAGGEPTLNFPALMAAQQEAEELSAETGIRLETVMLTNGYLLADKRIRFLREHNIRVMLSMDGPQASHNLNRPAVSTVSGSYERAERCLDRLISLGIIPHISITLTSLNIDKVADFVEQQLLKRCLSFSLNFYRPVMLPADDDLLLCPPEDLIRGMMGIYAVIEKRLPPYRIFDNLVDRAHPGRAYPFACGAGRQYLVIDCDGRVSHCQMEMGKPVTHIQAADPLSIIRTSNGIVPTAELDTCSSCIWRYRCAGGCPRFTHDNDGRSRMRAPLCEVYQRLLPAAIHLEASRLLRYEDPIPLL